MRPSSWATVTPGPGPPPPARPSTGPAPAADRHRGRRPLPGAAAGRGGGGQEHHPVGQLQAPGHGPGDGRRGVAPFDHEELVDAGRRLQFGQRRHQRGDHGPRAHRQAAAAVGQLLHHQGGVEQRHRRRRQQAGPAVGRQLGPVGPPVGGGRLIGAGPAALNPAGHGPQHLLLVVGEGEVHGGGHPFRVRCILAVTGDAPGAQDRGGRSGEGRGPGWRPSSAAPRRCRRRSSDPRW